MKTEEFLTYCENADTLTTKECKALAALTRLYRGEIATHLMSLHPDFRLTLTKVYLKKEEDILFELECQYLRMMA